MPPAGHLLPSIQHARTWMGTLLLTWSQRVLWSDLRVGSTWAPISAAPSAFLIKHTSPFLWQMLMGLVWEDMPVASENHRSALALTADSYLHHIAANGGVELPQGPPIRITLPTCRQVLSLGSGTARLATASNSGALVVYGDAEITPDAYSNRFAYSSSAYRKHFTVTTVEDEWLFNKTARSNMVANVGQTELADFGDAISEAVRTIGEADAGLHQCILDDVSFYSLIEGSEQEHKSFTVSGLKGVIFLSKCKSRTRLAEAIVHEYGHSQLYWLSDMDGLVVPDGGRRFYSPWREDPRPLIGLLHALYVFENVACFFHKLSATRPGSSDIDLPARISFIDLQIRAALAQIEGGSLTACGREIVNLIIQSINERQLAHTHNKEKAMERLQAHFISWQTNNPCLADPTDLHSLLQKAEAILTRGQL